MIDTIFIWDVTIVIMTVKSAFVPEYVSQRTLQSRRARPIRRRDGAEDSQ